MGEFAVGLTVGLIIGWWVTRAVMRALATLDRISGEDRT